MTDRSHFVTIQELKANIETYKELNTLLLRTLRRVEREKCIGLCERCMQEITDVTKA